MKKLFLISTFLLTCALGYSQEKNQELLKIAEIELNAALEEENYEKAAVLKKEIEKRKKIKNAVENGDYQAASKLMKELTTSIEMIPETTTAESKTTGEFNLSTTKPSEGFYLPEKENAAVYIIALRNAGNFEYFHEDQYIGKFKRNHYLRFECKAGKHLFWASSENKEFITVDLDAGKIYVIQATGAPGMHMAHASLKPISNSDTKALKKLKKVVSEVTASHVPETILRSMNDKLQRYSHEELNHYYTVAKDKHNFRHLSSDSYIPIEMLK
jgi:hypothetical protein